MKLRAAPILRPILLLLVPALMAGPGSLACRAALAAPGDVQAGAQPGVRAGAQPGAPAGAAGHAAAGAIEAPADPQPDSSEPLPVPPVPPRIAESPDYERCLDMLTADPAGADAFADTWESNGGGEPATHCQALAQIELGNPATGAGMLDKLAAGSDAPAAERAALFGQADQAWLMAGDPDRALGSATQALTLAPDEPDLLVEHSIAAAALSHYAEAEADLTQALALDPRRLDAWVSRATARRHLDRLAEAQSDIDHAMALDPDDPDALLERGIIRQRRGDLEGARQDWGRVEVLAPDTPSADAAEQNLALLQAGPGQ